MQAGPSTRLAPGASPMDGVKHTDGLYQLVAIRQEAQDFAFVSKPVAVVEEFARLCNDVAKGSFAADARSVDFERLSRSKFKSTAFFGYNDDVWHALLHAGLKAGDAVKEALQEGLLVFCPWLTADGQAEDDAASNELCQEARPLYVAAWAGDAVQQAGLHPPFNLTLRLLIALCPDVIVLVSSEAAVAFDDARKPFESGEGITEDYSVQQHTSAHTALQVQACQRLSVKVDPALWHRPCRHGDARGQFGGVVPSQVATSWHAVAKGAALVVSYHAALRFVKTELHPFPASLSGPLGPKKYKVALHENLRNKLFKQRGDLVAGLRCCQPLNPPGTSASVSGRDSVEKVFRKVLQDPMLLMLEHWQPDAFAAYRQRLGTLKKDVLQVVSEMSQGDKRKKDRSDQVDQPLKEYILEHTGKLMQRWFGFSQGYLDASTPSNVPQSCHGLALHPASAAAVQVSGTSGSMHSVQHTIPSHAAAMSHAAVTGAPSWQPGSTTQAPPMQPMEAASTLPSFFDLEKLRADERELLSEVERSLDRYRRVILETLAHALSWEALVKRNCPQAVSAGLWLPMEIARFVYYGSVQYMNLAQGAQPLRSSSLPDLEAVRTYASEHLLNPDPNVYPFAKGVADQLHKHPQILEMVFLLAAKSVDVAPQVHTDGVRRAAPFQPHAAKRFKLAVEIIAQWIEFDLAACVFEDELPKFFKGSIFVLSPFFETAQQHLDRSATAGMPAVEQEVIRAGFSRDRILQDAVMIAVLPQHIPQAYRDFFQAQDVITQGAESALKQAQERSASVATSNHASSSKPKLFRLFRKTAPSSSSRRDTGSDTTGPLPTRQVISQSHAHARMILRLPEQHVLASPLMHQPICNVASRLTVRLLDGPLAQFAGARAELAAKEAQELRHELQGRFAQCEAGLASWLQDTAGALQSAVQQSAAPSGESYTIKDIRPDPQYRQGAFVLECEHESTTSTFGSWTASVLSTSLQGEDADVRLDCQVVNHQENTEFIEMLGVGASSSSPLIISVRLNPGPGASNSSTEVFVHPKSSKPTYQHSKLHDRRPVLAARYEPSSRILALLMPAASSSARGAQGHVVLFCAFTLDYRQLQKTQALPVVLPGECTHGPERVPVYSGEVPFVLLPAVADSEGGGSADKMALIVEPERIALYNILSKSWEPESLGVATAGKQWLCTPCRTALLAVHHDASTHRWLLDAYSLEDGGSAQPLFSRILHNTALPDDVAALPRQGPRFATAAIDGGTYLLAANGHDVLATSLRLQSINVKNALADHRAARFGASAAPPAANRLLNYVHSCCLRFPLDDCVGLADPDVSQRAQQDNPMPRRTVRLQVATLYEEEERRMVKYLAAVLHHALHVASEKPSGQLLALQACSAPEANEQLEQLGGGGEDFGAWVRTAMCLVPLQLSRCMGNTLEPMHDGEPRRGVDASTDGGIGGMARALRLGLYESVLASHAGPVKFVCALGQQSMGKSYQLNHLGGTFFDVAGGRCTDGVWMSLRFMRDAGGAQVAVVFLDCEGIGSPQRHEVEDMLHCLLVGAVSSLTMFKTHFAFTTELKETLKRINKGAERVADICGTAGAAAATTGTASARAPGAPPEQRSVFRGSIMFCLKDVPPDSMRSIVKDFRQSLNSMICSGDNFASAIYNNRLSIAAFPTLSSKFYSTLQECVARLQHDDCPSYASGADAGYTLKMMTMKVAHKDWTAIDRQLIVSKAKAVRAVMLGVVHHGCEANLHPDGSTLGTAPLQFSSGAQQSSSKVELQQVTFTVALPAYVSTSAVVTDVLRQAQKHEPSKLHIQHLDAAAASRAPADGQGVMRMQWTMQVPDEHLRLGSAVQEAGAADGVLCVPAVLVQEDVRKLRRLLMDLLGLQRPDQDADQFRLLQAALQGLVQGLLQRRRTIATAWLAAATEAIRDTPEASELQTTLADHLRRLDSALQVCGATCNVCLLPCTALGSHAQHDCGTDHRCKAGCAFCALEVAAVPGTAVHLCRLQAGHHGRHMCADKPHACGKPCALKGRALNCNGVCAREPQHEGECDCECGNHLCGAACSLPGCGQPCKEPWGSFHARHSCGATACPTKCPLCGGGCPGGHFHALDEPAAHHLCGKEHRCVKPGTTTPSLCSHTGACSIEGQIQKVPRRFKGKRAEFEYDAVTRQNMHRKVCTVVIPLGRLRHDGPCSCGRRPEEHYCGAPCPQCLYRCTREAGHEGLHRAPHGNLENSHFVADTEEFDFKDRKYAVGDSAVAETCDSFCTNCGRGHLHYVKCDKRVCGSALHDCARHSSRTFAEPGGGAGAAMDEYTHDFHWQQLGFEDPVKTVDDLRTFRMCGNFCTSEEHLQDGVWDKRYCLLPLWHPPLDPRSDPKQHVPAGCTATDVFISEDGCLLPCKHVTVSDVHTFLVIDRSGSMGSTTIRPDSRDICEHRRFHGLNSVLGVVYEASHKYLLERASRAPRDVATFIPFNLSANVDFAGWAVSDPAPLLDRMMQTKSEGGTKFDQALRVMQEAVAQWRVTGTDNLKPVVILLTDSGDWEKESSVDVLRDIMTTEEEQLPEAERLTVHVIGFGPGVDENFIQELAAIGGGSHFTCQAARDMDRTNLVKAFSRIAARPGDQVALVPN